MSNIIYLVDLAGSENVGMSGATGDNLREASYINRYSRFFFSNFLNFKFSHEELGAHKKTKTGTTRNRRFVTHSAGEKYLITKWVGRCTTQNRFATSSAGTLLRTCAHEGCTVSCVTRAWLLEKLTQLSRKEKK